MSSEPRVEKVLRDVQNEKPSRPVEIDLVGVKNLIYPVKILQQDGQWQSTVATISMLVNLSSHRRGTHMSRFVELLNRYHRELTFTNIRRILKEIKQRLMSDYAYLEASFPYFILKESPVSGAKSLMNYDVTFKGSLGEEMQFRFDVTVPVMNLCPCSKEISEASAHNQRSRVKVSVETRRLLWIEDLVWCVEDAASSGLYALLKRHDEKFVTENAYMRPRFVEDVVREVADKLSEIEGLNWFMVESENFESIHNHNAYACIERNFRTKEK